MKQIPANPNHPVSYQPFQTGAQWAPYQEVAQQAQNAVIDTSTTKTSGIMDLLKKINPVGGNLTETLDQIQKFLKMAQSITPKIQEYGPFIKNLPAILAMMKEMDVEDKSDTEETEDGSTDVLDQLLGLDEESEKAKSKKQTIMTEAIEKSYQGDNLYKIETLEEKTQPKYQEPMLFI